jgi:hypothetical protein
MTDLNLIILVLPYLRVYKPHFFDKNLPSKIGVQLIYGILFIFYFFKKARSSEKSRYPKDNRACDTDIAYCELPVETISV